MLRYDYVQLCTCLVLDVLDRPVNLNEATHQLFVLFAQHRRHVHVVVVGLEQVGALYELPGLANTFDGVHDNLEARSDRLHQLAGGGVGPQQEVETAAAENQQQGTE